MLQLSFLITLAFLHQDAQDAAGQAFLADLKSAWAQEPGKVLTGEFSVEYFRIQDGGARRISIARMRQFLEQVKVAWPTSPTPAKVRELSLSLPIPKELIPNSWLSGRILIRGDQIRNTFKADLLPGAFPDEYDTSCVADLDTFYVVESKQASLFPTRSRWFKFGWNHMAFAPPREVDLAIVQIGPDTIRLKSDSTTEIEIDRKSKQLQSIRFSSGRVADERWQYGFSYHVGGDKSAMTFPAITASISYVDGYVTNCFLFVKKSVKFNHRILDSEFQISVPAGTNVVLFPGAEQNGKPIGSMVTKAPVDDVSKLRDNIQAR